MILPRHYGGVEGSLLKGVADDMMVRRVPVGKVLEKVALLDLRKDSN